MGCWRSRVSVEKIKSFPAAENGSPPHAPTLSDLLALGRLGPAWDGGWDGFKHARNPMVPGFGTVGRLPQGVCISPHPSTLSTHFVGHFAEHVPPTYDSKRPFLKSNACLTPPNVYSNGKKVKKPNVSRDPNGLTFFGDV